MRVWRIVPKGREAFDGEGTRRFGSRWVPKGLSAIYTSATLSLAALELLVHTDPDLQPAHLIAVPADIPAEVSTCELGLADLPRGWRDIPAPEELHGFGRAWIEERTSAVLSVPSVVIPSERNYVLNPAHPDFPRITFGEPQVFHFDPRLWR